MLSVLARAWMLAAMALVWVPSQAMAQEEPSGQTEDGVEPGEGPGTGAEDEEQDGDAGSTADTDQAEEKKEPEAKPAEEPKKGVVVLKRSGLPEPKVRKPFSILGAATLDREDTALRIAGGFPEVTALYHLPWDTDLEFAVGGAFIYGLNAMTALDFKGGAVVGEGRWRFFEDGEHSLALVATPSLMMGGGHSDLAAGLTIGFPGLVYDYAIQGDNHAIMGVSIPWGLFVGNKDGESGFSARIPLVFKMGMEFALAPLVHLFATAEMGIDTWVGDAPLPDGDGTYFFARGLVGAGFVL